MSRSALIVPAVRSDGNPKITASPSAQEPPPEAPTRQFKGVWFCAELWENSELTWTEKALIAEVDSLSGRGQACFAGNEHLAKRLKVMPTHMREMLASLTDLGYLVRLDFDGRRTLRCVNPEISSNPLAAKHLIEAYKVTKSSYRLKPKAQGRYRIKPKAAMGQNRELDSAKTETEKSKEEPQKETTTTARAQEPSPAAEPEVVVVVSSTVVGQEEEPTGELALVERQQLETLTAEFGLGAKQCAQVVASAKRKGSAYVLEQAEIVRATPGVKNAAGALLDALANGWKPRKKLARKVARRKAEELPATQMGSAPDYSAELALWQQANLKQRAAWFSDPSFGLLKMPKEGETPSKWFLGNLQSVLNAESRLKTL